MKAIKINLKFILIVLMSISSFQIYGQFNNKRDMESLLKDIEGFDSKESNQDSINYINNQSNNNLNTTPNVIVENYISPQRFSGMYGNYYGVYGNNWNYPFFNNYYSNYSWDVYPYSSYYSPYRLNYSVYSTLLWSGIDLLLGGNVWNYGFNYPYYSHYNTFYGGFCNPLYSSNNWYGGFGYSNRSRPARYGNTRLYSTTTLRNPGRYYSGISPVNITKRAPNKIKTSANIDKFIQEKQAVKLSSTNYHDAHIIQNKRAEKLSTSNLNKAVLVSQKTIQKNISQPLVTSRFSESRVTTRNEVYVNKPKVAYSNQRNRFVNKNNKYSYSNRPSSEINKKNSWQYRNSRFDNRMIQKPNTAAIRNNSYRNSSSLNHYVSPSLSKRSSDFNRSRNFSMPKNVYSTPSSVVGRNKNHSSRSYSNSRSFTPPSGGRYSTPSSNYRNKSTYHPNVNRSNNYSIPSNNNYRKSVTPYSSLNRRISH